VKSRDSDREHPGAGRQRGQLLSIPEDEWRTQGIGGSLTRHPLKQCHLGRVCRRVGEGVPDRDGQMASGSQDPQHLAESLPPIREEHQAKLADDGVAGLIRVG
jgi:hypothetical protein